MMKPLTEIWEIWRVAPRIRGGELSPTELVAACFEQIDRYESQLQAWVLVDRQAAMATAERRAVEAARGHYRGPLHGVPVGIKDIVDVAGMPTRAGSTLTDAAAATVDAPVVARLRAAGAIVLGKTVTTEFAGYDPAGTRNPWDLDRSPGGSSSGSAAAVAAGMCLAAIGSQTGGSLTRPASYCGVASCKPTFGRVDTTGVVPVSRHLDHLGPIARRTADLAYMLDAMVPDGGVVEAFVSGLRGRRPPRLGVLEEEFVDRAAPPVTLAIQDSLRLLEEAGGSLSVRSVPAGFDDVHAMHWRIMAVDVATFHRGRYLDRRSGYGRSLRALIEDGLGTSEVAYQEALAHQQRFRTAALEALAEVDALVTPATPTAAPLWQAGTGDPRFNIPWSYAGLPTVSLPSGLTPDGLPIALQLVGRPRDEPRLLSIAAWCERQLGGVFVPPLLSGTAGSAPEQTVW
jgi:Asp-tRNA(Asn)/Glu-tRNA(Gln) amidotransferase A subunit family amidase